MSVAPSPSSSRGEVILQPAYFTSSAFVDSARADVDGLLRQYLQQYTHSRDRPFALFRDIWQMRGWSWIQFKVFDSRSRAAFLRVVMRLFLERMGGAEMPLGRAAALFGLYMIIRTQPSTSAPSLYSVGQVEVTCDLYKVIMTLHDILDGAYLLPIRPHVIYVQSELLQMHAFQILPDAEMHPLNPRVLPREVVVEDDEVEPGKKGRPSRREMIKKARESLLTLDERCGAVLEPPVSETREWNANARSMFVAVVGGELRESEVAVMKRMEGINN